MHNTGLKIAEINKDLALLPENRLEVKNFVSFILSQNKDKKRKIIQMRCIWKGKGFESLEIDKEIKAVRQEMSESILKREV